MNKFLASIIMYISPMISYAQSAIDSVEVNMIKSEMIYEEAPFPSCHASTIVDTGNGLLAAWFGGTNEGHPDVCVYASFNKGSGWTEPVAIADGVQSSTLRYPTYNPVLFKRDNGDIVLYYKVGPEPQKWWGLYKISKDNGISWSAATKIPNNLLGPIKNKPVRLADGTILYPTSFETPDTWNIYLETSDQDLENWKRIEIDNAGYQAIQPSVLFHQDKRLQLLTRSKNQRITETWSDDNGQTWSPVTLTNLPNNNSGTDAVTLASGLHLLVYNPITEGRNKLAVAGSYDGKKWKDLIILEDFPTGEFSYPAIIEAPDGVVHITYTYNRKKIKYVALNVVRK